ncbi:glycosyltransferase family 39 protein|uniref:Dolichyl-phosphate-mannose-protein mannosyltransferase n=1 Tax=Dendrosporobacter quercicolus TaxID=146817 RepID=A0A1G9NMT6_9FIRM|nr:glycosyltransferase family 39 protein [Dendrosporobacter quercicolus DSM 1736]SDL87898.1 Dolichyl-phosphate-mannose-protein mannosyltransferase [Dendrosporobacter quercicolus]
MPTDKLLWITGMATLLIKSLLAYIIPFTGDEALFYTWATFPDIGYYDHPPMIGWLLALIMKFSASEYALRLPALIFPYIVGAVMYNLLKVLDINRARWAVILFLVSPLNMLNILVTTDTPLFLFVSLSAVCFYQGLHLNQRISLILAGVFLGGAFLSKYFSVLLIIAYGVYVLLYQRNRRGLAALALVAACTIPFVLLNVYYNYTHAWSNIMFNVFNRNHEMGSFTPGNFFVYLGQLLFLLTPFTMYCLFRPGKAVRHVAAAESLRRYYLVLCYVPLGILALLSFTKSIGMHWPLAFLPFAFILTIFHFHAATFRKVVLLVAICTFTVNSLIAYIVMNPPAKLTQSKLYQQALFYWKPRAVADLLTPYTKDYILTTESYSKSAVLYYYTGQYVSIFGPGSFHARHDDMYTDFRHFDQQNIAIVRTAPPDMNKYLPYFQTVSVTEIKLENTSLYLIQGSAFRYDVYRELVLRPIKNTYYQLPVWLPTPGNYFTNKYFAEE